MIYTWGSRGKPQVSKVAEWLPKHYEIRKSHYVEFYIAADRLFLKSKDGGIIKGRAQIYRHYLETEEPKALAYDKYLSKLKRWHRRGQNPADEPHPVEEMKASISFSYFCHILNAVMINS